MDSAEIERRKPIWIALSGLYLDIKLEPADFASIQILFHQSGYSINEIKQINYNEVAPLLINNFLNVAGEWSGFNDQWLIKNILKKLEKPVTRSNCTISNWLWHKRVDYFTKQFFDHVFNSK